MVDFVKMIELPWPPRILSPNARPHWRALWQAKKKYKSDAYYATKAMGMPKIPDGDIRLRIIFYPPTKRNRDEDNAIASIKAGLDGVAEAWGVNDSRFRSVPMMSHVVKNGSVQIILLKPLDPDLQNCNDTGTKGNAE